MNINDFKINKKKTLKEALLKIEKNHFGVIFIIDNDEKVIGISTDGDIRRYLINGGCLSDNILSSANQSFIWETDNSSRENLIKKLVRIIKCLPILDNNRKLISIVTRDNLPLVEENAVYARSRAPVRVSFGGGGSDLTHYFSQGKGAVINTAITIYSHAILKIREDKKIKINSLDLDEIFEADNLNEFLKKKNNFGLIQAIIKTIKPKSGFELYLYSDYPMNSGLGGSSTVSATVLGCFNEFRRDKWNQYELSELSYQAERLYLGISGGWQDQYATVFGGFNFIEFNNKNNIVHPLKFNTNTLLELEESLILCDTGVTHNSDLIHRDLSNQIFKNEIKDLIDANVELCYEIRNALFRGNLTKFGKLLDKAWFYKRQFSNKITSIEIDRIYKKAKVNGALGGKLLGAGGGGFFLFYVEPFKKHDLILYLKSEGLIIRPFSFETSGLKSWTVRENEFQKEKI